MARKKNVADLAQEALNSAALFDDDLTTKEKNSEGDHLPEDFFSAPAETTSGVAASAASETLTEDAPNSLPENDEMPEEPAAQDDFTLMPDTVEGDINEGESIGEDVKNTESSEIETEIDMLAEDVLAEEAEEMSAASDEENSAEMLDETSDELSDEDGDDDEGSASDDADENIEVESAIFLQEDELPGFLPEINEEQAAALLSDDNEGAGAVSVEGTELDGFESAEIEDVEFVEEERLESIVEGILFASDRPVSLASLKLVFKGTNITTQKIRRAIDQLQVEYAGGRRGITLEEVPGGYQLRTKIDNMEFMRRTLKARPFKLSGPALEVLAIVAYKQPTVKFEVDEIRGVESGHLLRALMEKNLVCFDGKSDLPGRPMQYGTTKKFLEIFGLRNLKELPTLSQIDELLPEGIGEEDEKEKQTLSTITDSMAEMSGSSYSQGEDELNKITEQLEEITTSSDFFEQEKVRQREKRDAEKAQNIREALAMNEEVSTRDVNWLKRYEEALAAAANPDLQQALAQFDTESEDGAPATADFNDTAARAAGDEDADLEQVAESDDEDRDEFEDELPFLGEADDIS